MPTELTNLVAAAKRGNKEAFGEIYRQFQERIYRFIYYLVYDEPLAEDITQETFVKAWKAMPGFSLEKGTLQSYLFTIARNLVIDNQRKKKEIPLNEDFGGALEQDANLEKNITDEENKEKVRNAFKNLDDGERQIIILRYFEELSFSEISKVIKKNEGAIRVRVHRILEKLKWKLKDI